MSVAARTVRACRGSHACGGTPVPRGTGVEPTVRCRNDPGGWGEGFVLALCRRWSGPEPRTAAGTASARAAAPGGEPRSSSRSSRTSGWRTWRTWRAGGGIRTGSKKAPVRYEAIDAGPDRVAAEATELGASVHMPRIGRGLAGGTWPGAGPLVTGRLVSRGIDVTVYDFGG